MNVGNQPSCEICRAPAWYWADVGGYEHYRCRGCGHLFVFPRPSQAELDAFYQRGEYYDAAERQRVRLLAEAVARVALLEHLARRFDLQRRILDVGCASGVFLSVAKQAGWDAIGIDRSEKVARKAQAQAGVTVFSGILEESGAQGAPYPIVSAWEVVEHAADVRGFFSALGQAVAPGGLLALSTPLGNGLPARLLGARYPMLTPPEHLSIFTRRSLGLLAAEHGFEEVDYRSFSNLGTREIASGIAKYVFGTCLDELSRPSQCLLNALGAVSVSIAALVDALGYGTEMQVVFVRKAE